MKAILPPLTMQEYDKLLKLVANNDTALFLKIVNHTRKVNENKNILSDLHSEGSSQEKHCDS